jgi:hypothetical protein
MRHLDRRTRVAVAAALLAPVVLLSGATTANADTSDDNPNAGWWDSSGSFDKSQRDSEPRARERNGSSQSDFDSDDDDESMPEESRRPDTRAADEAAQRFANDPGFSNSRPGPSSDTGDEPMDESPGMRGRQVENTAPGYDDEPDARNAEPGMEDGAGSGDRSPNAEDAKAARDEFSVEDPKHKSFNEGLERARRGRDSDVPKRVDKAEKSGKRSASKAKSAKSAKPKVQSKGKPKAAKR